MATESTTKKVEKTKKQPSAARLEAIAKAQARKAEIDVWREKAAKFDKISGVYHDEGFSYNRHRGRLVRLRNDWNEFFTTLEEETGDSGLF